MAAPQTLAYSFTGVLRPARFAARNRPDASQCGFMKTQLFRFAAWRATPVKPIAGGKVQNSADRRLSAAGFALQPALEIR